MGEFDFDELDKAVNSLMQKQSDIGTSTVKTSSVEQTSSQQDNATAAAQDATLDGTSSQARVAPVPAPATNTPIVDNKPAVDTSTQGGLSGGEKAGLSVKRRGRFMDVMHPSADMKDAAQSRPTQRPSRYANVVQPAGSTDMSSGESLNPDTVQQAEDTKPLTAIASPKLFASGAMTAVSA